MITRNKTILTITSLTSIIATYLTIKTISKYGVKGTLRYIWEGDHLPPHIRDAVDKLDEIELKMKKQMKRKLEKIETMIEVAKLNSVDGGEANDKVDDESTLLLSSTLPTLSKDLSMISYTLDQLAASVDSVQTYGEIDLKKSKKELSASIVQMMEKVDTYLKLCGVTYVV